MTKSIDFVILNLQMKKLVLILLALFIFPASLYAVDQVSPPGKRVGVDKDESVTQQGENLKLDQVEVGESTVQQQEGTENELKIQIQNKGEDQQLQTQTEEQEETAGRGIGKEVREMAIQQAGKAAQNAFQQMTKNMGEEMGLGEQVRQLAHEQNQVQEKINQGLEKIKARNRFFKLLFGPNKKALDNLEAQVEENQQLINQLDQMAEDADETTQDQIQTARQLIDQQNQYLQQAIETEQQNPGIFSFLIGLFK